MKLSGWKRIGILASVLWAIGGFIYGYQSIYGPALNIYSSIHQGCLSRADEPGSTDTPAGCDKQFDESLQTSGLEARNSGILIAFVPIPFAWGGVYLALLLFRWVRRGFPAAAATSVGDSDGSADIPPRLNQRWSRSQMLVGGCVAVLVVWLIYSHIESSRVIADDRQTIADLTAKQKASDDKPSFELQSRCGEAAKQYFKREWENAAPGMDKDYTSHYNPDLRRCFITIKTSAIQKNGTVFTTKGVFDAVEGKTYGEYVWQSDTVKKYWEVPPMQCNGLTLDGDEVQCHSEGEFEGLMSKFMDVSDD